MTPFLQLAFVLAVILLSARLAGYVSTRFGQSSVLDELGVLPLLRAYGRNRKDTTDENLNR